jgi:hypothetical protein
MSFKWTDLSLEAILWQWLDVHPCRCCLNGGICKTFFCTGVFNGIRDFGPWNFLIFFYLTRQAVYELYVVGPSRNTCCRETAIQTTYSECVSIALVIQHAKRVRCILSYVACLSVPYFSTLTAWFSEKFTVLNIKYVFWLRVKLLWWNIFRSQKNSARYFHKCTYMFM